MHIQMAKRFFMSGAALALAVAPTVIAQTLAPSLVVTNGQSVQQLFQAASEANAAGKYADALFIWISLESRVAKNARSTAVVRLRKGLALKELTRFDEAVPLIEAGLAAFPADDKTLDEDRFEGLMALGSIAKSRLDYRLALEHYAQAEPFAHDPMDRLAVALRKVDVGTFVDPNAALADMKHAEVLATSIDDKNKGATVQLASQRGRLMLNLGRFAEAEKDLAVGVKELGGLTMRVDYSDLVVRSDASIAALLNKHREVALNYLTYTGAGRLPKQDFLRGADMTLPTCGEDGVQPDDVAIVELGIGDTGNVVYARPVYGSRPGDLSLVFARAVAGWSWEASAVKDIPALFRMVTRLELRCSKSGRASPVIAIAARKYGDWLDALGAKPYKPKGDAEALRYVDLIEERKRREATDGVDALSLAFIYAELLENSVTPPAEVVKAADGLKRIMAAHPPAPMARLYFDYIEAIQKRDKTSSKRFAAQLIESHYAVDPRASAMAQIVNFDALTLPRKRANAAMLDRVIDDKRLDKEDVIRVAAFVRRASLRANDKDIEGARSDYEQTGLSEQQCSVVDAQPVLRSNGISSDDYPLDIERLGIEGWTSLEFDIDAKGETRNGRAIITYPPFVFSANASKMLGQMHFAQTYRPGGTLGCSASRRSITFRHPS